MPGRACRARHPAAEATATLIREVRMTRMVFCRKYKREMEGLDADTRSLCERASGRLSAAPEARYPLRA